MYVFCVYSEATVIATGSALPAPTNATWLILPEITPEMSPLPPSPPPLTLSNAVTPKSSQPIQLTPAGLIPGILTFNTWYPSWWPSLTKRWM